jgi:hypothetical protein
LQWVILSSLTPARFWVVKHPLALGKLEIP